MAVSQIHSNCDMFAHGWSPFLFAALLVTAYLRLSVTISQLVGDQPSHFI